MVRRSARTARSCLVCAATWLLACATGAPFERPKGAPLPIVDEATGKTFTDCRAAFAAATSETVLTFGRGSYACGPELPVATDWLVVRGAGLGQTFLEAGDGKLTALRPGGYLRVQDLAFGGITELAGEDSRVEIVRAAVASQRPALFGTPDRGLGGTIFVAHSVLASHAGPRPADDLLPRPLALNGNERVAVVESLLIDVEQEFERFPAPGSLVLLSEGVQVAFELHEPAQKARRQASFRANVTCGNTRNPGVFCVQNELPGEGALASVAALWREGRPLITTEPALRGLARGFEERFRTALGPGIRQPDVFWFDDLAAKQVEDEAPLAGKASLAILVRPHASEIVESCGRKDMGMRTVLERARALDRLLPSPTTAAECTARLAPRVEALVAGCTSGWSWEQLLSGAADADAALGGPSSAARACKEKLRDRVAALAGAGGLAAVYGREVNRALDLGATVGNASDRPTLDGVTAALPWIVLKTGRSIPMPDRPTLVDRIVKANQAPNAGDGRRLVEVTGACQLAPASAGAQTMKAVGKVVLAESLPNAAPDDEPRVVVEEPLQVTRSDLDAGTPSGSVNLAMVKRCDELTGVAYPNAVRRYVVEELTRQAIAGSVRTRVDAEIALLLALGVADGKEAKHQARNVPVVRAALASLQDALSRGATGFGAPAAATQQPKGAAAPPVPEEAPKGPPEWVMSDLTRAADILSRAGLVDTASCAFLLPQVPWKRDEEGLLGDVVLEQVPATLRCRPDARGFELGVWVEGGNATRLRITSELERTLTSRLGAPTAQRTSIGPAAAWPAPPRARTGFVYRTLPPAGSMLGYILVPLGSNWKYR